MVRTRSTWPWKHDIVATRVKELRRHHHLLLLSTRICVRSLPLVDQVEQVSLVGSILVANSTRSSNPVVSHRGGCRSKGTRASSVTVVLLRQHGHVVLRGIGSGLWGPKVVYWSRVTCVALAQFRHKIAIEHGLPHLNLLVG